MRVVDGGLCCYGVIRKIIWPRVRGGRGGAVKRGEGVLFGYGVRGGNVVWGEGGCEGSISHAREAQDNTAIDCTIFITHIDVKIIYLTDQVVLVS